MTINYTRQQLQDIEQQLADHQSGSALLLLFVGHAHSGHSIIGSILDNHPQVVLANEVNVVKAISEHRLSVRQVESVLLHEALVSSDKWINSAYQYDTAFGHQGQVKQKPRVIGDKKAGGTTRILHNHPWVLDYLQEQFGERLRVLFVQRNPVDVVAAYSHYMKQPIGQFHVDRYLENFATVQQVAKALPGDQFMTISQAAFVRQPQPQIEGALRFLGLGEAINSEQLKQWCSVVRSDLKGKSEFIEVPEHLASQLHNLS